MRYLIIAITLITKASFAQTGSDSLRFNNDFAIFKKALTETHPSLYRFNSRERLEVVFDSIQNQITNQTNELVFFRLLSKVESLIREGHSDIEMSDSLSKHIHTQKLFPFNVFVRGDILVVRECRSANYNSYKDNEIHMINGRSISSIIKQIGNSTGLKSGYNNSALLNILSTENNFSVAYHLFVDTTKTFLIEYAKTKNDALRSVELEGTSENSDQPYPIFPKEPRPPIHFKIDNSTKTAYLRITTFAYWIVSYNIKQYLSEFEDCFKKIKSQGVENLIIDVRNNRGGDEFIAANLLTYLISKEFKIYRYIKTKTLDFTYVNELPGASRWKGKPSYPQFSKRDYISTDSGYFKIHDELLNTFYPKKEFLFTGKTYILANGGSRSATNTFLALSKTYQIGTIIGQQSGGLYEDVDGRHFVRFTLPFSGIQVSFPAWSLKIDSRNGSRLGGVLPDFIVTTHTQDLISGKDVELELTYKLIRNE